ncbi:hypothetical protein PSH03_003269 [Micromonospora sp. PSH03]|uniref:hypothetical protein n=1 Tax=Micromonospora TaxID=1873 RepID=UPI001B36AA48|nr:MULTISPECIES: hypothetical protein [Micromonospora]MBQ0992038.1 hypothetical protein [Micromonospora sp. H61]MCG5454318.1 hypothetical protein [Micromonospora salmantinae]
MRTPIVAPGVLLAGAGLGGVVTVVTLLPGPVGLAAAIGVLCAGVFLLWPWAVLPVGIIGGTVVGALLSGGGVRGYNVVEVLLLAAGGAALAARHRLGSRRPRDDGAGARLAPAPSVRPIPVTGSDTGSGRPERRPWSCRQRPRRR